MPSPAAYSASLFSVSEGVNGASGSRNWLRFLEILPCFFCTGRVRASITSGEIQSSSNDSLYPSFGVMQADLPGIEMVTLLPRLAPRPADSNKGSFGRVLVVAGSLGMSGAAILCAQAAVRGGAGLVYLATPAAIQPVVAVANPCYLTIPLADASGCLAADALASIRSHMADKDVLALGPGLGRGSVLTNIIIELVKVASVPLVLDADGLNALEDQAGRLRGCPGPRILTPHPGEFARLLGIDVTAVQKERRKLAARFAMEHGVIVLLKGHETIVTDGRRMYENRTGNPGMATGGTGDVLTGLIAALLAQGLEPFAAAQLGAWWHGRAGDLARDELGEVCLIASDLLNYLPAALRLAGT